MAELVENSFALSTHLLKQDLKKVREMEPVEGFLNISYNGKPSVIDYSVEYYDDKAYLVVSFTEEPQRIWLQEHELTFGTRSYLTCGCGYRSNALYLKNGVFGCRKCQNIHYVSTMISHTSGHWERLSKSIRIMKLMEMREGIKRPYYKLRPTRRYLRWWGLCGKAGMFDGMVKDMKKTLV